jgi:NADH:ubiquinone oxidoreductase subunit 6 (subunit J)
VRAVDLIRAVLWLGITLIATAALYAMLGASFLAGVQLLLYVGGVMTLMVFGVMITRRHEGIAPTATDTVRPVRGAVVAASLFGLVAAAIVNTDGLDDAPARALAPLTLADLGRSILVEHLLAFEAALAAAARGHRRRGGDRPPQRRRDRCDVPGMSRRPSR